MVRKSKPQEVICEKLLDGPFFKLVMGSICVRNALDKPWKMLLKFTQDQGELNT